MPPPPAGPDGSPTIDVVTDVDQLAAIRELLHEYQAQLGISLDFQHFEKELAELPGAYAPPAGRLLLATQHGVALGCVALRPTADGSGEMKRLYVRASARGLGLGQALLDRILLEARGAGYSRIVLDTLPSMHAAQQMYLRAGFTEIAPYTSNPVPGARFLGLDFIAAHDHVVGEVR
ncbi:MAG: GNAT family N-acetyltransferase [Gemmatimonadota bacterium]